MKPMAIAGRTALAASKECRTDWGKVNPELIQSYSLSGFKGMQGKNVVRAYGISVVQP